MKSTKPIKLPSINTKLKINKTIRKNQLINKNNPVVKI
jgi:hypothetical protein